LVCHHSKLPTKSWCS